jgi:primosomal protein N' (replication factor Y)
MSENLIRVAVEAPLLEPLTYLGEAPESFARGQSVLVPLGKRKAKGVVLGPASIKGDFKLKPVHATLPERPRIPEEHLRWLEWLADYYMHPIGQVTALAFPPLDSAERKRKSNKSPVVKPVAPRPPPELTKEQAFVLSGIEKKKGFNVHLVHGVTGSGKTEIYLRLLADIVKEGRQGLVLVPEISLTPQLLERFSARFGDQIAVLHSHLTEREKTDQWWAAVRGEKSILLGARSALFCPLPNLGLIIIDEEHEASFKQDEKLKYHARDAAIMLAKFRDFPIVLGSATPSLESWHHATSGKYHLHRMTQRVGQRSMPTVAVVDLREDRQARKSEPTAERPFWMSEQLHLAIDHTFGQNEQVALFLNRRGIAQVAFCQSCGHTFECPNCAISLTVHGHRHLVCHYCDYTQKLPEHCPQCRSSEVEPLGLGTELIEQDMRSLYPDARIARADRDEISSRESLEHLISAVEHRDIDVLIGTQMIAKGLDFPGLTLVGLVLADVGFSLPDFRASERAFQLVTQVAGRAGRHSSVPGRVLIQTYNPQHPSVIATQNHDYETFAEEELKNRQELHYPPFSRLAMMRIQGLSLAKAEDAALFALKRALALKQSRAEYGHIQLLGPAPAPIAKLRNKFRYQALIKAESSPALRAFCKQLLGDSAWLPSGIKIGIDIDPINML